MRYYWCVNCGHSEDFGVNRKRKLVCTKCGYDEITELSDIEWEEELEKIKLREEDTDSPQEWLDKKLKEMMNANSNG